jgi:hypothetical protein
MTTKKVEDTGSIKRLERGRFAKLLAAGYTVEVKPSPKRKAIATNPPESSPDPRPSKA